MEKSQKQVYSVMIMKEYSVERRFDYLRTHVKIA